MKKRQNSYVLGLLLMLVGLNSCGIFSKQKTDANSDKGKSLLWEISGNGLQEKSYLFGTMHLICEEDYIWTPSMDNAMKSADALVMEMDISDMKMQMALAKHMMFGGDTTLADFLPKEKMLKLDEAFADNIMLQKSYKKMKPSFTSAMLAMEGFDCETQKSYEQIIADHFKKEKRKVYGLETVEDQVNALTSGDIREAAESLYEYVTNKGKAKSEMDKMVKVFKSQDVDKMEKLISDDAQYGAMAEELLHKRNRNWVTLLPSMLQKESLFIAVGAGHLGGSQGVINLLRSKGYTVKAVQ